MTKDVAVIDLNADMGEGFGPYAFGNDEALLRIVSSANIACGYHAGDPHTMRRTVELCLAHGVSVGAHPGLPDRMGFGRREMRVSPLEAADWLLYQIGALQAIAASAGAFVHHVKLHGALYHMAAQDGELAEAAVRAVQAADSRLLLYGPPNSQLARQSEARGLTFIAEGFADRAYLPDGRLAPRSEPGAVLEKPEQVIAQALSLIRTGSVRCRDGGQAELAVGTICLHGDAPLAAEHARRLHAGLREAGVAIRAPN